MQVPTEIIGMVTGIFVALASTIIALAWFLRGAFRDQREASRDYVQLITDTRKEAEEDRRQRNALEAQVDLLHADRRKDRESISQLELDLKQAKREAGTLREMGARWESERSALQNTIQERDERIERLDKRVAALEDERNQLRTERDTLQKERERLHAEVERLRCAVEERDELAEQVEVLRGKVELLEKRGTGPLVEQAEPGESKATEQPETNGEGEQVNGH